MSQVLRWTTIVAFFALLLCGNAAPAEGAPRGMKLTIVHRDTGKPIPGVQATVQLDNQRADPLALDSKGQIEFIWDDPMPQSVRISVKKEGFVPITIAWRGTDGADAIPESYTVKLQPGTTIGGIVQDEQGKPVGGAAVYLLVPTDSAARERIAISNHTVTTDAQGRWRCDIMPADLRQVMIRLAHVDYITDEVYGTTSAPPIEALRAQTGVMVLKKGAELAGTVMDESGKPIASATIAQGPDRFGSNYPQTTSDGQGRFRFANVRPGPVVLTVQARGFAPDLRQVTVQSGMSGVEFKLGPARTIKGRLVDPDGKPIAGAFVVADGWRNFRSLSWRVDTDAQGRFEWNEAPADAVLFDFGKQGYQYVRRHSLTPRDEEHVITLPRPLVVRGTVTDARTGKPVDTFRIVTGISFDAQRPPTWEHRSQRPGKGGQFEVQFTNPYPGHLVRIEADGYLPAISPAYKSTDGARTFDARLQPAAPIAGVVMLPDGKPAAGAEVMLVTASSQTFVQNGRSRPGSGGAPPTLTDAEGRFSFTPEPDPYILLVLHDAGSARMDREQFSRSQEIRLQPWATVKGQVMIGAKPGGNEVVNLQYLSGYDPAAPRLQLSYTATTDAAGNFTLTRVMPGEAQVSRTVITRMANNMQSHSPTNPVALEIKPGETCTVQIGGVGRPIAGRVEMPDLPKGSYTFSSGHIMTRQERPRLPDKWDQMSNEEKQAWSRQYMESPEYKRAQREMRRFNLQVQPDGTFRVDDVPAGAYTASVSISDAAGGRPFGEHLGGGSIEFTVPEIPGGRSDEVLDVGIIKLNVLKRVKVGDAAPAFEVPSLDGKQQISLARHKGKFVLLDFWAVWCGPCIAETPHLKAAYDAYGRDERFVIIGLSLDPKAETTQQYVQTNRMSWEQGFLGDWSKATLPSEYGVSGIPSIWLIGPDGRVLARDLRGERIKEAVGSALGR